MRVARLVGAALTFGLGVNAWSATGEAADLTTAGWWWRAQTGTLALPAPPHVPAGGLAVGNGPEGPTSLSALRFAVEDDEIDPVLSLVISEELAPPEVGLTACPSATPWFGIQAGPWAERPEADCDRAKVDGVRSEDGTSWSFPLAALHSDGLLDVVVMPAEGSGPFEISFDPPSAASLQTTPAPATTEFGSGGGTESEGFTLPASGFEGGVDFGRPLDPVPTFAEPGGGEPAEGPSGGSDRREFVSIARPGAPAAAEADPRLLAVVILLAALGTALALRREPLPTPRLLGPMADRRSAPPEDEEVRGLGRFRRPRRGAAPSLN